MLLPMLRRRVGGCARSRTPLRDDHHDAAEALGKLLEALGCDVRLAYSGAEALQVAPAFRPRLVILDIEMPGLSGVQTARLMRKQPWARQSVFASHSGSGHGESCGHSLLNRIRGSL